MTLQAHRAAGLPSVDRVLGCAALAEAVERFGRHAVTASVRDVLAQARHDIARQDIARQDIARQDIARQAGPALDEASLAAAVVRRLEADATPSLRPVFNLTGTVLHTNLGRALLPEEACRAVASVLSQPSNLEFDLDGGARGDRDEHIEALLCRLTGAQAATIVNNNAAAVLLVLNALADRREVLVSRGELVEIGGSFRIPDVMARAGCRLREVGTTNRTHLRDFADAIGPRTAMVLKVHASNYEIQGFTAAVPERDLAALCRAQGIPFGIDLGSGSLIDFAAWGLPKEATVQEALAHAQIVTFSGDKLLGGVQCGLVVGDRALISRIRRNPLKRALRVDKMTLAAMEAVLRLYLHPERLAERLPTLRLLTRAGPDIRAAAERLCPVVQRAMDSHAEVTVAGCESQIGSGALPLKTLPSWCLALRPRAPGRREGAWLKRVAAAFRALPVPVIGRVDDGALRLDLRTLEDEEGFSEQLAQLAI